MPQTNIISRTNKIDISTQHNSGSHPNNSRAKKVDYPGGVDRTDGIVMHRILMHGQRQLNPVFTSGMRHFPVPLLARKESAAYLRLYGACLACSIFSPYQFPLILAVDRSCSRMHRAASTMLRNAASVSAQRWVLSPQSGLTKSRAGGIKSVARCRSVSISSTRGSRGKWIFVYARPDLFRVMERTEAIQ